MSRIFLITSLVLLLVLIGGGVLMYLAYGLSDRAPSLLHVEGMGDSTSIERFEDGSVRIRAQSEEDAYAALGYVHAQEHGWTMALYRRSALGRLAEWFGDDMLELDQLSLRLGLARGARDAYISLEERNQNTLEAYARGVNAALATRSVQMRHEFVALNVDPDRWEPWHALAVERLLAWMSAARPDDDALASAGGDLASFFDADDLMRRWLHLHGFENSLSWSVRDSSGTLLVQRHVYGATTLPLFQSVRVEWPGAEPLIGASLIGSPFLPAGKRGERSWAILLSSSLSLERVVRDTTQVAPVYERLISADGEEHLIRVDRSESEIFFASPRPFFEVNVPATLPSDTAAAAGEGVQPSSEGAAQQGWALRWSGFVQGSDTDAWGALVDGDEPVFELFDGDGLGVGSDGATHILGRPLIAREHDAGAFISNSSWSTYAADRFDTLIAAGDNLVRAPEIIDDRRSTWAVRLAPSFVESAIAVPNQPAIVTEALAFLRNWDFEYDNASIAASIFDTWMTVYRDSLGVEPQPSSPDSAHVETLLHYELLVEAIETLSDEHGDNLSQWRWEDVRPKHYFFPLFSADSLLSSDISPLPRTRYSTIRIPGAGHPTTLFWGPSAIDDNVSSPATWEAWASTGEFDEFRVRSRSFRANRFFGRYVVSDRPPMSSSIASPDQLTDSVLLLPQ